MTTFFRFEYPPQFSKAALWDKGVEPHVSECPLGMLHRGVGGRSTPLKIVIKTKRVDDIIWTVYSECILQNHVFEIFFKEGLTGFTVRPVPWRSDRKDLVPPVGPLRELVVTGWGGFARADSGMKLLKNYRCCGRLTYKEVTKPCEIVDPEQWDGSDFFIVWPLPKLIFISERVKEVLAKYKLKGFEVQPPIVRPVGTGTISPGRLSDYFPLERAKELAKGQDIV
ncbi:MAG: hypothetical protein WC712_06825 [Candidatus Brocadiia bacterium]